MRPSTIKMGVLVIAVLLSALGLWTAFSSLSHLPWNSRPSESVRFRELYFDLDFERAVAEGQAVAAREALSEEAEAWLVLNQARAGAKAEALKRATALKAKHPDSPWASFALAGATIYDEQRSGIALSESARALAADTSNLDFVWLRAETLRLRHQFAESAELIASQARRGRDQRLLASVSGAIAFDQAMEAGFSDSTVRRALAHFSHAQANDSEETADYYLPGWFLMQARRPSDAMPHLRKAAALSYSPRIHFLYWSAVSENSALAAARKVELIRSDVRKVLRPAIETPELLEGAAEIYRQMGLSRDAARTTKRLLKRFPQSPEAARLELEALRQMPWSPRVRLEVGKLAQRRELQGTAVQREINETLLAMVTRDSQASVHEVVTVTSTLLAIAPEDLGAHIRVADLLADRAPVDAEVFTLRALKRVSSLVQASDFPDSETREAAVRGATSRLRNALGWALVQQGRYKAGLAELHQAVTLDPESAAAMLHLAAGYEKRADFREADEWYAQCLSSSSAGTNLCEAALREAYSRRPGITLPVTTHLDAIRREASRRRLLRVSSSRLPKGPSLLFDLTSLEGERYQSTDLLGRSLVITFWGIWCSVCRDELPELDRLARRFTNQRDVQFLTVNDGQQVAEVRQWARAQRLSVPILKGSSYMSALGVRTVPTTWFVDRQGQKVFEVVGHPASFEAEFLARIELLRGPGTEPRTGTVSAPRRLQKGAR